VKSHSFGFALDSFRADDAAIAFPLTTIATRLRPAQLLTPASGMGEFDAHTFRNSRATFRLEDYMPQGRDQRQLAGT
jgi:hypothetical protein